MKELIQTQGRLADEKLAAQKLTLTTGGEPTFVPLDSKAPEWNIAALGPEKLLYARKLARSLVETQFKGGVILQSFGKQYPNEPLPRWQVGVYRSRSGEPLWKDLGRLRLDQEELPDGHQEKPKAFIEALAKKLGLSNTVLPAFEDLEAKLKFTDSDESIRLLPRFNRKDRSFESRALSEEAVKTWSAFFEPAGWVLPLGYEEGKWLTGEWKLPAGDDLTLIPGDSPIGLRLPLKRLPEDALKCGLTVEFKDNELIVFLPPLVKWQAFVELVRAIEELVASLDCPPIRLEGYPPPRDPDLESIALTSDPGVLEVNLPPVDNWDDFDSLIHGLFASAEGIGMRGYKYQLSGRTVSTGGGAHIILGGPSLDDNPFIKRPTLLSSLLRFLQRHPALSFAFSGLFIGPSSQAPRVDESAYELPYELGIALRALEQMDAPGSATMIDGLLRNLLMDWNGNTHRAELSVDKFYNGDAPNGRCGLIEFRAFEMVPTPEMLMLPNVILRTLTACFAEEPYTEPLVDWREALHDRFALPFFLREDLVKVFAYLNGHGFSFEDSLLDAQFGFRFPIVTRFEKDGVRWTLRQALEPWPVMGDHQGVGRVVDSTTDRLELLVEGEGIHKSMGACVNGIRMPLERIDDNTLICGVRYRLFDNPWGLQPHVKAHSPLQFELFDAGTKEVRHAFEYLNWKQTGGNYDGLPADRAEADARVADRVRELNDRIGRKVDPRVVALSAHAPFTLDLRRC